MLKTIIDSLLEKLTAKSDPKRVLAEHLRDTIKSIAQQYGLKTAQDVADLFGVDLRTAKGWLLADRLCSADNLAIIADILSGRSKIVFSFGRWQLVASHGETDETKPR